MIVILINLFSCCSSDFCYLMFLLCLGVLFSCLMIELVVCRNGIVC